jgi:hypothetical protein
MDINNYIDLCVINNTHYDISLVVFKILKGKYRYIKNNIWEYLDKNGCWVIDKAQSNLKYSIKTDIYRCFIKRSIEWSENKKANNDNLENTIMFNKLLFISSKLLENKFISSIIKESRQFFI